jgi:hypothetical protein
MTATDILAEVQAFLGSPSGLAVKALLVGTLLVFLLGALAALRDGTFRLAYIDSFVRSTIWGRVAPVLVVLLVGYLGNAQEVTAAGVVVAGAVAAGLIGSAIDSIRQLAMTREASAQENMPPQA